MQFQVFDNGDSDGKEFEQIAAFKMLGCAAEYVSGLLAGGYDAQIREGEKILWDSRGEESIDEFINKNVE